MVGKDKKACSCKTWGEPVEQGKQVYRMDVDLTERGIGEAKETGKIF